jgi:hypothetical protein
LLAAIIAALGVVMAPEELADVSASGADDVSIAVPTGLTGVSDGASHGSVAISQQVQSASVSGVSVRVGNSGGGGSSDYRSGDISMDGSSSGYGIQSMNLNTGVGSIGQTGVSIAAGSLSFGALAK